MIRIEIRRGPDRSITGFTMKGHADYAEAGKDIVCAGVTAVAFGTVNAIEELLDINLNPLTPQRGHLELEIPAAIEGRAKEDLQLLLESMVSMIKGIEASYRKHVRLKEITRN